MHTSFSLLATARQASGLFINNNRNRCYMHTLLLTYIHTIANLSLTLTYFFSSLSTLFLNLHVLFLQAVEEGGRARRRASLVGPESRVLSLSHRSRVTLSFFSFLFPPSLLVFYWNSYSDWCMLRFISLVSFVH